MTPVELADEWLQGRQWIRCDGCGRVADAEDEDEAGMLLVGDGSKIVGAFCVETCVPDWLREEAA